MRGRGESPKEHVLPQEYVLARYFLASSLSKWTLRGLRGRLEREKQYPSPFLRFLPVFFLFCYDYFALHDSLRVRHVALDDIPGTARKHSEGGVWAIQPT